MPEKIRSFYVLFPVNSLIPFMEKTVQQNFPLLLYLACRSVEFKSLQAHAFLSLSSFITKPDIDESSKTTYKCLKHLCNLFQYELAVITAFTAVNALISGLFKILKKIVTLQPHFSAVLLFYTLRKGRHITSL